MQDQSKKRLLKLRLHDAFSLTDSFVSLYEFQSDQTRINKFEQSHSR